MADATSIRSGFMLPDYVREIATTHFGLRVLYLRISELQPANREDDVLRALEANLRQLSKTGTARIFRMPNSDFLLSFHQDQTDRVRALMVRLRFLVPDDPLAELFAGEADQNNRLLRWWKLEDDFETLRALADELEAEAIKRAEAIAKREGTRAGIATVDAAKAAAAAHEKLLGAHFNGMPGDPTAPEPDSADATRPLGSRSTTSAGAASRDTGLDEPNWRPISASGPAAASARGSESKDRRGRRPIDLDILDRLENGLARADLSNHVRRQPVCALVGNAPPQPVFSEIFVSIPDLRETIAPNVDLTANRWLFQHFTETLDRRILSWLNQGGARLTNAGFSININVNTILSEHFLRFEKVLAAGLHGTVVLELRVEDVFADVEAFAFARDFVHQRGYRLCLDFLTPDMLSLLNRDRMGVDLLKIFWHPDLPDQLATKAGQRVSEHLRKGDAGRTIFSRCDTVDAVRFGRSLGITMYQGRYIDDLLNIVGGPVSPEGWT